MYSIYTERQPYSLQLLNFLPLPTIVNPKRQMEHKYSYLPTLFPKLSSFSNPVDESTMKLKSLHMSSFHLKAYRPNLKKNLKADIKLHPVPQVTNVFARLASLTKVTFEATARHPTKKLGSLVNINNHHEPFRSSPLPHHLDHPTLEMQTDPNTAQALPTMAAVTDQAPPSPRRSTISALPAPATRTRKNGGNGQCTHLTTTRLYTEDFRCALCLRVGSFGWLYRCTQDRELLLDEDMENGFEVSICPQRTHMPPPFP